MLPASEPACIRAVFLHLIPSEKPSPPGSF
jgi:hypothetical protein